MEVVERQQPKIIHMAPVRGPWSHLHNINPNHSDTYQKRKKYLPMVELCARVAQFQIEHGRYFLIENPASSKIWYTRCLQRLLMKQAVTYGTLDMCALGMRDPNGYYHYKPTSLLHNFSGGTLDPVFKRCSNKSNDGTFHQHQPLEGSAPGYGSKTKLAQVYPYKFCSVLIKSILPLGNSRALYPSQLSLTIDLLDCLDIDELRGVQKQLADFSAVEHSVFASDVLHEHGLPVFQCVTTIRYACSIVSTLYQQVMFPLMAAEVPQICAEDAADAEDARRRRRRQKPTPDYHLRCLLRKFRIGISCQTVLTHPKIVILICNVLVTPLKNLQHNTFNI